MSKLYAWGYGQQSQLGDGYNYNRSSPVQIGAESDWDFVRAGYRRSFGIRGGQLFVTGFSSFAGFLGLGAGEMSQSSPVQIGAATDWSRVETGAAFNIGLKTTGKLYAWGSNSSGKLGLGDTTTRSSPVQVGAQTDWADVRTGNNFVVAVKSTGKLYSWGANNYGQLGHGHTTNLSSPAQVGAQTDWEKAGCGDDFWIGLKTTGKLYACGRNNAGQLGLGDTTNRSSPVQVGAQTDWADIDAGDLFWLGKKDTNKLYSCGNNGYGQLGLGDTVNRSSPVQVGTQTDWDVFSAGLRFWAGTKTTGELYSCGSYSYGKLGLGAGGTDVSSPVQVGSNIGWASVSAKVNHVWALSDFDPSAMAVGKMSLSQSLDSVFLDYLDNGLTDNMATSQSLDSIVLASQSHIEINNLGISPSLGSTSIVVRYYLKTQSLLSLHGLDYVDLTGATLLAVKNMASRFRLSEWLQLKKSPTLSVNNLHQSVVLDEPHSSCNFRVETNSLLQETQITAPALSYGMPVQVGGLLCSSALDSLLPESNKMLSVNPLAVSQLFQNIVTTKQ